MMVQLFRKSTISSNTEFGLTAKGKHKAEEFGGDTKSRILATMDEIGSATISDLAKESGIGKRRIEKNLRWLVQHNYVYVVRGDDEGTARREP